MSVCHHCLQTQNVLDVVMSVRHHCLQTQNVVSCTANQTLHLWFDDLYFALIWPSRLSGPSVSRIRQSSDLRWLQGSLQTDRRVFPRLSPQGHQFRDQEALRCASSPSSVYSSSSSVYRTGFTGNAVASEDSSDKQVALALSLIHIWRCRRWP